MRFYADLHIHSKYSRACSKDCDIEHLAWWARRKGVTVVGTGDFTHPAWRAHLREVLEPAEPGLLRLRPEYERELSRTLPASCHTPVRFMLSVEIATIYKQGDYTRKVHHLCYVPDFEAAEEFSRRLGNIGNLGSDGRPILGLDSRDLLEITLESGQGSYLVPAHIWTPWFAVLGSKAGFNSVQECYRDLADNIFALETGLSSDPEMNWRLSGLDGYTLVSHSDAHSPPMLAREATVFDTELDYFAIRRALETGRGVEGTVEFFPEEGKYHLDGHRKCGIRFDPADTRDHGRLCPECGKPLTVGVLNRVDALADRDVGVRPSGAAGYRNLIPLPEIIGELRGVGPKSKKVFGEISALTARHGSELAILEDVPVERLRADDPLLAEAIERLRGGSVHRQAGFDGEYGRIRVFEPEELSRLRSRGSVSLFDDSVLRAAAARPAESDPAARSVAAVEEPTTSPLPGGEHEGSAPVPAGGADAGEVNAGAGVLAGLDPDQRAAAEVRSGPLMIVAGPGTGKTRTVTHRLAHLIRERGVAARECLAITFTRRAAVELADRLGELVGSQVVEEVSVATFHSLGMDIVRDNHAALGLPAEFGVADGRRRDEILAGLTGDERGARRLGSEISRARRGGEVRQEVERLLPGYLEALRAEGLVDFDDLLVLPVRLLEADAGLVERYRQRFRWITVDEYQDVDEVQYRLLRLLAPAAANVTVIGDPDQAIYGFRGADVGFFLRFEQDYPDAPVLELTRNYRSGRHIVEGAVRAIEPGSLVPGRQLRPVGGVAEHPVVVHRASDEHAEARFVARTVDELLGGSSFHSFDSGRTDGYEAGSIGFGDVAVVYRTDAQSRVLREELVRQGFPVQKRSHDPLSARPGVGPLLDELGYVSEGSGEVTERLRAAAERVVATVPGEHDTVHAAVELLRPLAARFGVDVEGFRREVLLGAEVDALDPRADAVSLLTLHAAKGLEYPVVFLVGCEDGLLPLRWPGEQREDDAEERRLFFVGVTRAQRRLYVTRAARRGGSDEGRQRFPSPFLSELGSAAVRSEEDGGGRRQQRQLTLL
ncbi:MULTISPECIES: UvrD-helicase domain-containing protein [unclassified Actinopolyspora]|uniref:UvrD-helicase domain-containing protein n=1 Tax=unclassified Actinopolyspora TaxID=2639451 RepID=UPI0013F67065|nr:UvrD-helicase domain-containing protein [Actinopolyspora sp. BKK2]NHE75110.1 UvrD-helicase domain-containing protein [Actinopolyspora sp. BKK1]